MSVHPRSPQDLLLAPVAIEIDTNLRRLRDRSPDELLYQLALELDRPVDIGDRSARERAVVEMATRWVHLHGYEVAISTDATRLHLSGGSESIDLGLSRSIADYISGAV
jgi:histidinol phosphatase-like PHP family hydrolase